MATVQTKNIYFARHGERTDWIDRTWIETAKRQYDSPLSSYGLQQAHELGIYITELKPRITHIYASPFLRTIQTALQVAKELNKNVLSNNDLIRIRLEPGYGEFHGSDAMWNENNIFQPLDEHTEILQYIEYFDQDYQSIFKPDYYLQVKGETRQQLRDRLKRVLQCTLDAHADDCNILIITHAATLVEGVRALITITKEHNQGIEITTIQEQNNTSTWDMSPIRAGVCSLTHCEFIDKKWTLSKTGLASYLSKGEQRIWYFPEDKSLYETSE
ncbi:unnamed protein product [Adineta steineri]|uniref:Phosphoglycerate mutase n=1 Tax=Adineta steineri TaxID=433720 RepID=A0A814ZHB4_9BILA|nr:unnamed protein product [Adineta steineri]